MTENQAQRLSDEELELLRELCACGSTPGDEVPLARRVAARWRMAGWRPQALGRYAVYAHSPEWLTGRPTVLVCAHLDSPGFIVDGVPDVADEAAHCVALGHPHPLPDGATAVRLRGRDGGEYAGELRCLCEDEQEVSGTEGRRPELGDRVWFAPQFAVDAAAGLLVTPFLDNRAGCWALCRLAELLGQGGRQRANVIVAATAQEEMTGFGAAVLAAQVRADLVVCLDATYENLAQDVALGGGPVLTVSDRSTLQAPALLPLLSRLFGRWGLPLSFEVYNNSGTDAAAFPQAGVASPALALLLPTRGNHSPQETASLADLAAYREMTARLCGDAEALDALLDYWNGWLPDAEGRP
ncbi:MAG: M20/M25/M40 family metallo-hydrolase [Oligosphaeraceae bacterium]